MSGAVHRCPDAADVGAWALRAGGRRLVCQCGALVSPRAGGWHATRGLWQCTLVACTCASVRAPSPQCGTTRRDCGGRGRRSVPAAGCRRRTCMHLTFRAQAAQPSRGDRDARGDLPVRAPLASPTRLTRRRSSERVLNGNNYQLTGRRGDQLVVLPSSSALKWPAFDAASFGRRRRPASPPAAPRSEQGHHGARLHQWRAQIIGS